MGSVLPRTSRREEDYGIRRRKLSYETFYKKNRTLYIKPAYSLNPIPAYRKLLYGISE